MNLEIKEIINNLKLANKNNLDKIYLQIEDDEKTEIINLGLLSVFTVMCGIAIPFPSAVDPIFSRFINELSN